MTKNVFFMDESKKTVQIGLRKSQVEYLNTKNNKNAYVRHLLDNDKDYQKFMKEKKNEKQTGT